MQQLQNLYDSIDKERDASIAICFLHSYLYPKHEMIVEDLARSIGFKHVYRSSSVIPMIKAVPRGQSTTADAYLSPLILKYVDGFYRYFDGEPNVMFMKSDGGLVSASHFHGLPAILSGPAAGMIGYSKVVSEKFPGQAVIGFDMGGTSTDVSRFSDHLEHVYETVTAGVHLKTPQLDIQTVAAGGGSCLAFKEGIFVVGPEVRFIVLLVYYYLI